MVSAGEAATITTMAGNGVQGYSGDGGPATSAALNLPRGVAVDAAGNVYVADASNHRIRRVAAGTGTISTVAGGGGYGYSGDGGPAVGASLFYPHDVAVDSAGNLYIADIENSRVRRVDGVTGVITTLAGTGSAGFSGDGGLATLARLNAPEGVAVDGRGNVFIADMVEQRVRRVDQQTGVITTVAGNGTGGYSGDGGAASSASLWEPASVAVGTDGSLYIGDYRNHRVRRVDAVSGVITTVAGSGVAGSSGDGGPAISASLMYPHTVALDRAGRLYITDNGNGRVRRVDLGTGVITTIAGNGVAGYAGDGGPATDASFQGPYGVAVDGDGNVYVGDPGNHRVRKVTALDVAAGGMPDLQIGGRVCYSSRTYYARYNLAPGEIYAMEAYGTGSVRITDNPAYDGRPSWSPDGSQIVFISNRDVPTQNVYVADADGTNVRRLTDSSAGDAYPAWSPDGSRITFTSARAGYSAIYSVRTDGFGLTQLTSNPSGDSYSDWSPDGTKIAFTSIRDGNADIYVMNADGSAPTRLTTDPASDADPEWSPDGSQLTFWSDRAGSYDVFTMRADGTDQQRLTSTPYHEYTPTWASAGDRVLYTLVPTGEQEVIPGSGGGDVYVMNRDGSNQQNLTRSAGGTESEPSCQPFRRIGSAATGTLISRVMTVQNGGAAPLSVTGITASDWRFVATPSAFVVAAGGSRAVTVAFAPDSVGVRYATLTIASNDPDLPFAQLIINGTGVAANHPPVLTAIGHQTVAVGDSLTVVMSATDADGDSLSYSVTGGPTGSELIGAVFSWVPELAQVGVHTLTFAAADGCGGTDSSLATITVTDPSAPPTLTAHLPGGVTMDFVWIEPGTFAMGSPDLESGREADEGPQHQVTLTHGFYLARTELTQGQWLSAMGTSPWAGQAAVLSSSNPAVYVSWEDVQGLVHVLNTAAGDSLYRLPTEAEWEYACRAGATTRWSFGDDLSQLTQYAWYRANAWDVGLQGPQAVATKLPNPWGLYDMIGNVDEWVQDWYAPY